MNAWVGIYISRHTSIPLTWAEDRCLRSNTLSLGLRDRCELKSAYPPPKSCSTLTGVTRFEVTSSTSRRDIGRLYGS